MKRQTDFVILGLLSESPLTGYQIKKIIDVRFRFFWSESYGQLYPALKSLLQEGLIEEITSDSSKRAQKTYAILPSGLSLLQDWIQEPVERETVRFEILMKMYFSHLVEADVMIRHLLVFQQAHEMDLKLLRMFENELKPIIDQDPNHPYVLRVIDFGQKVNEAYLEWTKETLLFLESRKEK
jgi:DNA-binding PadR family transcriptional regulator